MTFDTIIHGAQVWCQNTLQNIDIGITGKKIAFVGHITLQKNTAEHTRVIDAKGLCVLPGVIDTQVHFRDPGMPHKETLATGTKSAILGGVTTIFDMPNTNPNTICPNTLAQKIRIAEQSAFCNFAFYMGGVPQDKNWSKLEKLPGCPGIKIFIGSSTGNLLVERKPDIETIVQKSHGPIAFHCEDESRLKERAPIAKKAKDVRFHPVWRDEKTALESTRMVLQIAKKQQHFVHILHITTQEEIMLLKQYKGIASVEVTPQHLSFDANDYKRLGTRIQMNPPIRKKYHQDMLWRAVNDGTVTMIGSDHAPHTAEEKSRPYPQSPSGMPGVQTTLPVMLTHMHNKKLSLHKLTQLLMHNPAKRFQIKNKGHIAPGFDADLVLVDLQKTHTLKDAQMAYQCGWTPFDGFKAKGKPYMTLLGGHVVMENDCITAPPSGRIVHFKRG